MKALQQENTQLRAQLLSQQVAQIAAPLAPGLEGRVAKLEASLTGLQDTLRLFVGMLTALLGKRRKTKKRDR